MDLVIDKMRADFAQVAALRRASGAWSEEDEAMAGGAIREAIKADDRGLVYCWAAWLAQLSARDLEESFEVPPNEPSSRGCNTCEHRAKPGRSHGYCSGRDDISPAYGKGHPLRVLPKDGGLSCARWKGVL